jgi:hypothetical protein
MCGRTPDKPKIRRLKLSVYVWRGANEASKNVSLLLKEQIQPSNTQRVSGRAVVSEFFKMKQLGFSFLNRRRLCSPLFGYRFRNTVACVNGLLKNAQTKSPILLRVKFPMGIKLFFFLLNCYLTCV